MSKFRLLASLLMWLSVWSCTSWAQSRPNIVLFFADDLGYADLGCFGGQHRSTPNLDKLANSGIRLTSFYASQAVCSASRSSLLTGCYNVRIGILGALGPKAKTCLNPQETTVAEMLKTAGYSTAIFGKWHLGDRGDGLPLNHGFDRFQGLPYSNDMWPLHPTSKNFPPLPMFSNNDVVNANVKPEDQRQLTTEATKHAIEFIQQNKQQPFFLYMPYNMPHVPLFVSEQHENKTGHGLYADVVAEIDWSVGQILASIQAEGKSENTLVWFTSDNGPWLSYGNHAGSAGPLREGKGTTWEGGVREPSIVSWPGKIKPGIESDQVTATIDVLPTLAEIVGAKLPELKIDGASIWPILSSSPEAKSPHDAYFYYWNKELQAVRSGPWKLHFPHSYRSLKNQPGADGLPGDYIEKQCGLELYNLESDIGESTNVASANSAIVERLQSVAEAMRQRLGDSLTSVTGSEIRPAGVLD